MLPHPTSRPGPRAGGPQRVTVGNLESVGMLTTSNRPGRSPGRAPSGHSPRLRDHSQRGMSPLRAVASSPPRRPGARDVHRSPPAPVLVSPHDPSSVASCGGDRQDPAALRAVKASRPRSNRQQSARRADREHSRGQHGWAGPGSWKHDTRSGRGAGTRVARMVR